MPITKVGQDLLDESKRLKRHCQICGRMIKAPQGHPTVEKEEDAKIRIDGSETIAHHGYKRPHQEGWQTASCFGARYRPYELACDALPPAIQSVEAHIARRQDVLASLLANPPAQFDCERTDKWSGKTKKWTLMKPDDFTIETKDYHMGDYISEFNNRRRRLERDIEASVATRDGLKERLKNWKAPK